MAGCFGRMPRAVRWSERGRLLRPDRMPTTGCFGRMPTNGCFSLVLTAGRSRGAGPDGFVTIRLANSTTYRR